MFSLSIPLNESFDSFTASLTSFYSFIFVENMILTFTGQANLKRNTQEWTGLES
jgi:hypothetical protein